MSAKAQAMKATAITQSHTSAQCLTSSLYVEERVASGELPTGSGTLSLVTRLCPKAPKSCQPKVDKTGQDFI